MTTHLLLTERKKDYLLVYGFACSATAMQAPSYGLYKDIKLLKG